MTRRAPRMTVREACSWSGAGLHSGASAKVVLHPGAEGIAFRRGPTRTLASAANVVDTRRCTSLAGFATVEHLMSALAAAGITDAEVEVEGEELPGLDGSAAPYALAINQVGTIRIGTSEVEGLYEHVYAVDGDAKVGIGVGAGHFRYHFDLVAHGLGEQVAEIELSGPNYFIEISPARTVVFAHEVEQARAAGLGRGLDASGVLVIGKGKYENAARFPDEPARHKLLDLIGDLALSQVPLGLLNVVSHRSGHRLNVRAALDLAARVTVRRVDSTTDG